MGPVDVVGVGVPSLGVTFDLLPCPSIGQSVNEARWNGGLAGGKAVSVVDCVEVGLLHPRRKWVVVEHHCVPFGVDQAVLYCLWASGGCSIETHTSGSSCHTPAADMRVVGHLWMSRSFVLLHPTCNSYAPIHEVQEVVYICLCVM